MTRARKWELMEGDKVNTDKTGVAAGHGLLMDADKVNIDWINTDKADVAVGCGN